MTERYGVTDRRAEQVRQILAAEPGVSDREIGRRLGCHHSFPNRIRREMRDEHDAGRSIAERAEETFEEGFVLKLSDLEIVNALTDRQIATEETVAQMNAVLWDMRERLVGMRDLMTRHISVEEWERAVKGRAG